MFEFVKELKKILWVKVIPIIVGALGMVLKGWRGD